MHTHHKETEQKTYMATILEV